MTGMAAKQRGGGKWPVRFSVARSRTDSPLSATAQRLDQSRESRRLLTSTGIVKENGGVQSASTRTSSLRHVLGREGMPRPCSAAFLITAISSTVSCPSTRPLISRAPFSNSQAW